jgi:hypothetical protein
LKTSKNIRDYESGAKLGTFDEKRGGRKSRATVPLKAIVEILYAVIRIMHYNRNY